MEDVCQDLVRFSGSKDYTEARVYVNDLFEPVWADMPERLKRNVTPNLHLDQSSPHILGNETQIQVAVRMLIQNALEAMPDGGKLSYWTSDKGGQITIRV